MFKGRVYDAKMEGEGVGGGGGVDLCFDLQPQEVKNLPKNLPKNDKNFDNYLTYNIFYQKSCPKISQ